MTTGCSRVKSRSAGIQDLARKMSVVKTVIQSSAMQGLRRMASTHIRQEPVSGRSDKKAGSEDNSSQSSEISEPSGHAAAAAHELTYLAKKTSHETK